MKKVIALSVCAFLGAVTGYFAAPFAAVPVVQASDSAMFWGAILAGAKAEVICDCIGRPTSESAKLVSDHLSTLNRIRKSNPNSKILGQEMGLEYVRLSMLEDKLGQKSQSEEDMKRGQAELAALGWKNVSESHLVYLLTQLDSGYAPPVDTNGKNAAPLATAR
jgi:hypothetical protein